MLFICTFNCVCLSGGGSGFVGRELTRLLRDKGHEVTVISRQPGPGKITWVWAGGSAIHSLHPSHSAANWCTQMMNSDFLSALVYWTSLWIQGCLDCCVFCSCRANWSLEACPLVKVPSTWQGRMFLTRFDGELTWCWRLFLKNCNLSFCVY